MCSLSKSTPLLHVFKRWLGSTAHRTESDIQALCHKFSKERLEPTASQLDLSGSFPKEHIDQLGRLGLMAITAPPKYGGAGLNTASVSVAVEELSRGCASTGAIVSIHNILYIDLLASFANENQKAKFLTPFTKGTPGAFALSEPDAGSDVANISTTATKNGDYFILNGSKSWVTSAKEAEVAIIFATVDKNLKRRGITAFLVPLAERGVCVSTPDRKMGIRATSTCDITLTDVKVPCENVIGVVGDGFKTAMNQLNKARIGIASQALGIAQAALDTSVKYSKERCAFGQQIKDFQAVQLRLARTAANVEAARLLVREAAKCYDEGKDIIKISAIAKLMASEAATFSAHQCIQIMGGMGYIECSPAQRYYRDARVTEIYGGVSDIQMLIIADQLLKDV